jgi:hypothetical protein
MLDHEWGKEAFKRFPELIDRFDSVESPGALRIELRLALKMRTKSPEMRT